MIRQYIQVNPATPEGGNLWQPRPDWVDILTVGDNEINLLVTEGSGLAFVVTTTSGTYSIDYGDGTVETGRVSGTTYQHQHLINGTPCTQGYNTWKVRIYDASTAITRFYIERHSYTARNQSHPILGAVFGTQGITSYANAFYKNSALVCNNLQFCKIASFASCLSTVQMFMSCQGLASVTLPSSWGAVTNANSMFFNCFVLSSITLPLSWGNVTNVVAMFWTCYGLTSLVLPVSWGLITDVSYFFYMCYGLCGLSAITLPTSWGSVTSAVGMFASCYGLSAIVLPATWGNITNLMTFFQACKSLVRVTLPTYWGAVSVVRSMFDGCSALSSVTLPTSWGSISDAYNIFNGCYSLKTITGINYLGSLSAQSDLADLLKDCEFVQQDIVIGSLLKAVGVYGASGYPLKVTSVRLTNAGSTFTGAAYWGTSRHVDVSYTSMAAAALNLLFGDLPTLTGKIIVITGCPGAATCDRSIATAKGWSVTG